MHMQFFDDRLWHINVERIGDDLAANRALCWWFFQQDVGTKPTYTQMPIYTQQRSDYL